MDSNDKLVRILDWQRMDVEQRLAFTGGKYTDVNFWLSFSAGIILTVAVYGLLIIDRESRIAQVFLERGPTQYFTVWLAMWSLSILVVKWGKLRFQRRALDLMIVPHSHDFVLAPTTAPQILERMYGLVDDPKHFVLLNRIERALSNLSNIGMISDASEMLKSQAQNDEDHMESSYSLVRGFIWGIPVLGFIGTVLGLSMAINRFGVVLAASEDVIAKLKTELQNVTLGLSTAFDTTLVALIAALVIQLLLTALKKKEEAFLDDCKDYAHANIISKLRLIHVADAGDPAAPQSR